MKARVKVDAFQNDTLAGVVSEVAPLPDPSHGGFLQTLYTTRISIGRGHPNLRPGMTAEAEMIVADRDDAIGVPVGGGRPLRRQGPRGREGARRPGRVARRGPGGSDGATVEIKDGLRTSDQLILDPRPLLSDEQRARMTMPMQPARKKSATSKKGLAKPARPPR